jgi:Asp-tRNA(Asn)/Glu-tRNA(Gln) amidotransferase A subunit family amidase
MTVPVRLENGLSAGLQLMTRRGDEVKMLAVAELLTNLLK